MTKPSRRSVLIGLTMAPFAIATKPARAQDYPQRPIRVVPGGYTVGVIDSAFTINPGLFGTVCRTAPRTTSPRCRYLRAPRWCSSFRRRCRPIRFRS
jgi:hypothetical protein